MLPIEQCYGVIVVAKEEGDNKFLILQQGDTKDDDWSFPKGHTEKSETPIQTAMRELKEETGITEINILNFPLIREEYEIFHRGEQRLKVNEYFIGLVREPKEVILDGSELCSYKWATLEDALNTFTYPGRREVLKIADSYLKNESLK